MGEGTMPRIAIHSGNANWLRWGQLVQGWINDPKSNPHPTTVKELKDQLDAANVRATVEGGPNRAVRIYQYPDGPNSPLWIPIPSAKMLAEKMKLAKAGPYPTKLMPAFYGLADGHAKRGRLTKQHAQDFALRRVGEYTVNECC
jgi:hypothetical protein